MGNQTELPGSIGSARHIHGGTSQPFFHFNISHSLSHYRLAAILAFGDRSISRNYGGGAQTSAANELSESPAHKGNVKSEPGCCEDGGGLGAGFTNLGFVTGASSSSEAKRSMSSESEALSGAGATSAHCVADIKWRSVKPL